MEPMDNYSKHITTMTVRIMLKDKALEMLRAEFPDQEIEDTPTILGLVQPLDHTHLLTYRDDPMKVYTLMCKLCHDGKIPEGQYWLPEKEEDETLRD